MSAAMSTSAVTSTPRMTFASASAFFPSHPDIDLALSSEYHGAHGINALSAHYMMHSVGSFGTFSLEEALATATKSYR
jgi:hypothetical protein